MSGAEADWTSSFTGLITSLSLEYVSLEPDACARSKSVARASVAAGSTVMRDHALASAVFPEEKGARCDHCHRRPSGGDRLLKCTGCAAFWYCGITCQTKQWQAHHRKICKRYNRFIASPEYQALDDGGRTDVWLLSQLLAQVYPSDDYNRPIPTEPASISIFFDLLKGTQIELQIPPLCRPADPRMRQLASEIFARFGNNNFVLHSHLTSYAHGIFPLASRLFNHSCYPNCAVKYVINQGDSIRMEVVVIRDIQEGEEITIPYLDPALPYHTRQTALRANYGFSCNCALCSFQKTFDPAPHVPMDSEFMRYLEDKLCIHVASRVLQLDSRSATPPQQVGVPPWTDIPADILPLFKTESLPHLSETFSKSSHEGQYDVALETGRTLLAYYASVYPANYPQIGMHALELAKTAWNYTVAYDDTMASHSPFSVTERAEDSARHYLVLARSVLECFGAEGDEGGPLDETGVLQGLLGT